MPKARVMVSSGFRKIMKVRSDINRVNSRRGRLARRAVSNRSTMPKARAMVPSGFRK
jgi:hypothetical protein